MIKTLLLAILLFFSIGCDQDEDKRQGVNSIETEILVKVNAHRAGLGKSALSNCDYCAELAREHSLNMANGTVDFGHDLFDERFDLLAVELNAKTAAENVAEGYSNATAVVNGWLNSTGHRENIEGDYSHLGTGIATSEDGTLYFTQIFVKI